MLDSREVAIVDVSLFLSSFHSFFYPWYLFAHFDNRNKETFSLLGFVSSAQDADRSTKGRAPP